MARSAATFAAILASALSTKQASVRLGRGEARIRQMLVDRSLASFLVDGVRYLPAYQFGSDRGLVSNVTLVNRTLRPALHPVEVYRWLHRPNEDLFLDGNIDATVSPLAWLAAGHEPERVIALADRIWRSDRRDCSSAEAWMNKERCAATPASVALRVVIGRRRDCRETTLLSSMLDPASRSKDRVCELHGRRWGVESDFKSIKYGLGAGVLAYRTPEMIVKELWAHLLGYNLIHLLAGEAARTHRHKPRDISFRHTA